MKKYHNFVDRNVILYLAIQQAHESGITEDDTMILNTVGLKECLLSGLPDWLVKWTSLTCKYV